MYVNLSLRCNVGEQLERGISPFFDKTIKALLLFFFCTRSNLFSCAPLNTIAVFNVWLEHFVKMTYFVLKLPILQTNRRMELGALGDNARKFMNEH